MKKKDLIKALAENAGTTQADSERVLDALTDTIVRAMKRGEEVTIPGIGKLTVAQRAPKAARNPITGEAVQVPARLAPKFSASSTLKAALNG